MPSASTAGIAQGTTTPQFRAGIDILQLDVSVLDRDRRPVRGLSAGDFIVEIGGKSVPVVAFTPVALPPATAPPAGWMQDLAPDVASNQLPEEGRLIVLLFDRSLVFDQMASARRIARTTVGTMAPSDLAAVSYVGQAVPQNFTADRSRLLATIEQPFLGRPTDPLNPSPAGPIDLGDGGECFCGTCKLVAIEQIANALRPVERRRKILIFIGSTITFQVPPPSGAGVDCSVPLREARTRLFRALDRANLVVHTLDPVGLATGAAAASGRRRLGAGAESARQLNLGVLPARTGGRVVVNMNRPEEKVAEVLRESESYYVLGVERPAPSAKQDDQEIKVRVDRKNVTVSSARAYNPVAVPAVPVLQPSPNDPPRSLVDVLAAVWPATSIDLTMTASAFGGPGNGLSTVAIVTTITEPAGASETPQGTRTLNVLAGSWDRNGRPIATQTRAVEVSPVSGGTAEGPRAFAIASRLQLPRGKHDIRVAVEDPATGKKGSVYTTVEIPNFDREDLSLSDLAVGAAPAAPLAPAGIFSDLLPIIPTTTRVFSQTSRMAAFVRAYQGGRDVPRDVTMSATLLGVSETPIHRETTTLAAARFARTRSTDYLIEVPVAQLAPGPYLLTLEASLDDKRVTRHMRFEMK